MSTGTVARVPRPWSPNLPALAWLPASAPSVQGLPAPPTGGRTRPARALPGPARNDVESLSATSSPLPDHIFLTTPNDSCRKPPSCGSAAHPRPPVGRAPSGTPNPRQGQRPASCSPWPVRHRDSGGSRPHSRHRSRPRCGRLPLCRHGARFPSHRPPATATGKPSPRPAGLPSPYRLTVRIRPFDPSNRDNFDSVSIRTANYQNSGILRFDPESPFRTDAPAPNAGSGVAPHRPVSAPQTGGDSVSWTRTGTDTPQPWLGHATRYGTRGDNGRTA